MSKNIKVRFFIIALVLGFLGFKAYQGVFHDQLELGIDLKGGSEIVFEFDFEDTAAKKELLTQAIGVIQERIDRYGLKDIVIQPIGENRFSVQVSALEKDKVDAIKELITDLGHLEFHITVEPGADGYDYYWRRFQDQLAKGVQPDAAREIPPEDLRKEDQARFPLGLRWFPLSDRAKKEYAPSRRPTGADGKPQPWVLCEVDDFDITGEALYNVIHARDRGGLGTGFAVYFRVKKLYQNAMAKLTKDEGDHMAILLNGHVDSAPVLKSTLSDSGQITGGFTEIQARSLAAILQAGALQTKPKMISERTIAPDLAGGARKRGVLSTLIGFVVVLAIMAWLYLGPGLLANLALLLNLILLVGVLTWFDAVLTLPGIAGVVLTVGMAVDANILVFERIKEEKAKGRTINQAIATGYDRAFVTIVDSNLTTLITAYFLFQIGSGPVRGFGITLAVGIVASMFTALYVTRTMFMWLMRRRTVVEAKMRGGFSTPKVRWTGFVRRTVGISVAGMLAGALLWDLVPEKVKYDLDFTQGSKLIVRFHEETTSDEVHAAVDALAKRDPVYRDIMVRVSAEGIGAHLAQDRGRGFELRSQNVATAEQIDAFKGALRESFKGRLLPGPFQNTIRDDGAGGCVGTIYFLDTRVTAPLLEAVFGEYFKETGKLPGARVEAVPTAAGAGAAFEVHFDEPAKNPGQIRLKVDEAFARFDLAKSRAALDELANSEEAKPSEQAAAKRLAEQLKTFDKADLTPKFFAQCDPFPLADRIDPSTAEEHRDAAVQAVALSIIGIIIYVAFRFRSWTFGFAAVIALIHDVLIVLGVVALANWVGMADARLNLVTVAAFLTLIGYSINDTIVVFDRIRENSGTGRTRLREIIDRSINQTFTRTIRTSTTTWVVVVILMVMNLGANSSLEGFAFILTFGVIVGTYSSIFIASPTLLYLPWLWERCGATVKGFSKRCIPYMIVTAALLIGIDALEGRFDFTSDFSVPLFNNILLAIPVGILALFLLNFLRFVRLETEQA